MKIELVDPIARAKRLVHHASIEHMLTHARVQTALGPDLGWETDEIRRWLIEYESAVSAYQEALEGLLAAEREAVEEKIR